MYKGTAASTCLRGLPLGILPLQDPGPGLAQLPWPSLEQPLINTKAQGLTHLLKALVNRRTQGPCVLFKITPQ